MRGWLFTVVGVLLVLIGGVWIFQGIGILGGSFMTGQKLWFAIGILVALAGIALLFGGVRRFAVRRR